MKLTTARGDELVELVEAACKLDSGEGWDYPVIIERLEELAEEVRDAVESGDHDGKGFVTLKLHEDDHAILAGLAQVLASVLWTKVPGDEDINRPLERRPREVPSDQATKVPAEPSGEPLIEVGSVVEIVWPGSSSGVDRKRARVAVVKDEGRRLAVNVARVDTKGAYTGRWGKSLRWIYSHEIVFVVEEPGPAPQGELAL